MANLNKVILAGNLTRDPELRYTPKGTPIAGFGLAINKTWTNETGEKKEKVCFVDCKAFAAPAETIAKYLAKGKPLLIEGRLDLESWEDKDTKDKRQKLLVVVENFQFLNAAPKGEKKESGKTSPPPASEKVDDVPF